MRHSSKPAIRGAIVGAALAAMSAGDAVAESTSPDARPLERAVEVVIERHVLSWGFDVARVHQDGRVSVFPMPSPCPEPIGTSAVPSSCLEYRGPGNAAEPVIDPQRLDALMADAGEAWRAECRTTPAPPTADWAERVTVYRRDEPGGPWQGKVVFAFQGPNQTVCGPGDMLGTRLNQSIPRVGRVRSSLVVAPGHSAVESCPDVATLDRSGDDVLLLLQTDESGRPRDTTLLRSSGDDAVDAQVLACARRLVYRPVGDEAQTPGALWMLKWGQVRRYGPPGQP